MANTSHVSSFTVSAGSCSRSWTWLGWGASAAGRVNSRSSLSWPHSPEDVRWHGFGVKTTGLEALTGLQGSQVQLDGQPRLEHGRDTQSADGRPHTPALWQLPGLREGLEVTVLLDLAVSEYRNAA